MGNFSSRQNKVDNARERDNKRRDRLAGYFYDLSKLSFAGLVISQLVSHHHRVGAYRIVCHAG